MKICSTVLLAISVLGYSQFPFDATGAVSDPDTVMADKISGGPGSDYIDDRNVLVNVNGQAQNLARSVGGDMVTAPITAGFPFTGLGYGSAIGLPYVGMGLGVGAFPYAGLGYGATFTNAGLGYETAIGLPAAYRV